MINYNQAVLEILERVIEDLLGTLSHLNLKYRAKEVCYHIASTGGIPGHIHYDEPSREEDRDNKQEAIERIRGRLAQARGFQLYDAQHVAERLYREIVPLIRGEFPEEEISKLRKMIKSWCLKAEDGRESNVACSLYACAGELENWTNDLERLWEGQPLREGDFILEQEKPKGTCPRCKGGGKLPPNPIYPCPACGGTGECQHKGNVGWIPADNKIGPPICFDCHQEVERRSGKERRYPGRYDPAAYLLDCGKSALLYEHVDGGETPSYEFDRRTLPDRRKAE